MPRGDKSKYTDKQKRKAEHIAEGYEKRGVDEKEAERRAWATVNKGDAGGREPGGRDAESTPAIPLPIREATSVARRRRRDQRKNVQPQRKGRRHTREVRQLGGCRTS